LEISQPIDAQLVAEFKLWKWIRAHTVGRLSSHSLPPSSPEQDAWKERKEAESAVRNYLSDFPSVL
jgi:hypothetical protein